MRSRRLRRSPIPPSRIRRSSRRLRRSGGHERAGRGRSLRRAAFPGPPPARAFPRGRLTGGQPGRRAWPAPSSSGAVWLLSLVDQHHGDVIPNWVAQAALRADDVFGVLLVANLASTARAHQDVQQFLVHRHQSPLPSYCRISARTSAVFSFSRSSVAASTFSRSSGSVFEARTLNHQSSYSTVSPSSQSCRPPAYARAIFSMVPCWSRTTELISPEDAYRSNGSRSSDSGRPAFDIWSMTTMAATSPESAR